MTNNTASILSSNPPWPGKSVPVSLTPAFLLSHDSNRSPVTHKKLKIKVTKNNNGSTKFVVYVINSKSATKPPAHPCHVFLGERLGANRCLPNSFPITYAAASCIMVTPKDHKTRDCVIGF